MKTVYICSEYFAPYQNVGSMKFSKIAKYFSRDKEYQIIIFSRKNFSHKTDALLAEDLREIQRNQGRVFYVDAGEKYYKQTAKLYRKLNKVWCKIAGYDLNYYVSNVRSAKKFCSNAIKVMQEHNLPKPDYIISTYDDWGSHYFAMHLKEQLQEDVVWIADFRDPVGAAIKKGIFRKLCDQYTYRVTEKADYTTVVSEGLLHNMKMHPAARTSVATNGFDYEDYERVLVDKNKLHFVYTGSFYHERQTMIPVLQVIKELISEGKVEEQLIAIEYAGAYSVEVYGEVCKLGLENCWYDWGEVTRYQAILIQKRADILMTLVWNSEAEQGVLAGKTLGYLMLNKPIIAIVGGDLADSSMKKFVEETNCGFCYEEATHAKDYKKLKGKIMEYYTQKQKYGEVKQEYSKNAQKYNFENITELYKDIIS